MTGTVQSTTRFRLTQLALRAAVELDRARSGAEAHGEPLQALAQALLQTTRGDEGGGPFRFIDPGFYQPLQRLYCDQESVRASDIEHIQGLIRRVSDDLARAAEGSRADTEALVRFCVALHQELIEDLTAEDALVVHEGRIYGHGTAPSLGAA